MATETPGSTALLKAQAGGLMKSHAEYDGYGRLTAVWTAAIGVGDDGPCTKVSYQYADVNAGQPAGSTLVSETKEENVNEWDTAWDF